MPGGVRHISMVSGSVRGCRSFLNCCLPYYLYMQIIAVGQARVSLVVSSESAFDPSEEQLIPQSANKENCHDRRQSRRRPDEPGPVRPRGYRGKGLPPDHRTWSTGRAVRHVSGDDCSVLPVFLHGAAAL